jgi:flagellar hook protein FlgE
LLEERDAAGNLVDKIPITINFDTGGPTQPQTILLDFGKNINFEGATTEEAMEGTTHFASPFDTIFLAQDGFPVGHLLNFTVDEDGLLSGYYSNGQVWPIAYIAVARFVNNEGLLRTGRTLWVETPESGQAIIGLAAQGGRGKMLQKTLEQSNVDLANEFINMIVYQRAFQASSRAITVSDAILADLAGLIR